MSEELGKISSGFRADENTSTKGIYMSREEVLVLVHKSTGMVVTCDELKAADLMRQPVEHRGRV